MRFFAGPTLLVIEELGYLPPPGEAASALFQVVSQRYLKTSIVPTINRGVASWGDVLGDTTVAAAMLDRLLHRSVVLNLDGDSYRLRDHHAKNDAPRQATTGTRRPLQRPTPRVGNFDEHHWGTSASAITATQGPFHKSPKPVVDDGDADKRRRRPRSSISSRRFSNQSLHACMRR
jgi:hypothetical protein